MAVDKNYISSSSWNEEQENEEKQLTYLPLIIWLIYYKIQVLLLKYYLRLYAFGHLKRRFYYQLSTVKICL
jgi:hypothetical protein